MLSVIMAVYNGETYIRDAIDSILSQTFTDLELIIINDGSTDRTKDVINQFLTDKRLKVLHLDKNQGAANALNIAVNHSKGDWISVHDADDISYPTRLEEQYNYIKKLDNISAVGTLIECINGLLPGSNNELMYIEKNYNSFITVEEIMNIRFYVNPICHGSMMFSKEIFELVGGYNTKYKIAYDYDLWMRFMNVKPIVKIPQVLYKWRVYENSLHRKNEFETSNEVLQISSNQINTIFLQNKNASNVVVIGSEKGCENYKNIIKDIDGLIVDKYLNSPTVMSIRSLMNDIKYKRLDAIIVLESEIGRKVMNYLSTKRGLRYNDNLFFLWSVY